MPRSPRDLLVRTPSGVRAIAIWDSAVVAGVVPRRRAHLPPVPPLGVGCHQQTFFHALPVFMVGLGRSCGWRAWRASSRC